jgi:predicted transcriptional regulator
MLRSINSTFKRKPKKRVVSRSFRIPPEVDRMLDAEAAKRDVSKSFLIKDIIHSWYVYHQAKGKIE